MEITANYFQRIVPFEFKNLFSGSYNMMLGILGHTLLNVFRWQRCSSQYCSYEHGPKLGRKPVTGDPVGSDAAVSGIELAISDWRGANKEEFERMSDEDKKKFTTHGEDMIHQVQLLTSFRYINSTHVSLTDMGRDG